jgi:hypothetical protein
MPQLIGVQDRIEVLGFLKSEIGMPVKEYGDRVLISVIFLQCD